MFSDQMQPYEETKKNTCLEQLETSFKCFMKCKLFFFFSLDAFMFTNIMEKVSKIKYVLSIIKNTSKIVKKKIRGKKEKLN